MLQVGWSVEGLQRMERHGRLHLPTVFQIQLEQYDSAGADCLQQVHPTIPPSSPPPPPPLTHNWSCQEKKYYAQMPMDWLISP